MVRHMAGRPGRKVVEKASTETLRGWMEQWAEMVVLQRSILLKVLLVFLGAQPLRR